MPTEVLNNNFSTDLIKQIPTLKGALEASLRDGKITPEEAKGLESKFLLDKGKISEQTRKEWRELSYQLRSEFQKQIGDTKVLGAIGLGTIRALQNIASKAELSPVERHVDIQPRAKEVVNEYKSLVNEDELLSGLTGFIDFQDSEKYSIDLKKGKIPDGIDEKSKNEAQKLLDISKNIDGVDDGRISFTKDGKVILEINTMGSDLYIQSNGDNYLVTGQLEGKFFTYNIKQGDFNDFVKNHDSENTKKVLEELGFIGGITFVGVMAFLIRTGIGLYIPTAVSLGVGAYRGYELYKMYNLSTNDTVSIGEKYRDKPEFLKKYLFLSQLGYITGTSGDNFTTIDGEKLSQKDIETKYKEIKGNESLEKKYLLLSQLLVRGYNPKFSKEENKYELDFFGLFDETSLKFDGNKVILKTDGFNDGKEMEFNLKDTEKVLKKIADINEILRLKSEKRNKEAVYNENNPALSSADGITKLGVDIKTLEDNLKK